MQPSEPAYDNTWNLDLIVTGTQRPLKNYARDRPLDFHYKRTTQSNLCVVAAWECYFRRKRLIPRPKDRVFVKIKGSI